MALSPLPSVFAALVASSPGYLSPRLLHPKQAGTIRAAVRFEERPTGADLRALARAGARPVELVVGGLAVVGRIVSVDVAQADLPKAARVPGVRRIEPVIPPVRVTPLDVTNRKVGALAAWDPPAEPNERFAGDGVVLADHEGGWNIYHPDFFRLDGGLYDFEDRDGDGKAGPGDGIDLDGDGQYEGTLSLLEGLRENIYLGEMRVGDPGYQPDVDWLYVDMNGNRTRDFGSGFSESTPGLGEPIFVGDDVDGNGRLDLGEKLVRVGSPKVRTVVEGGSQYVRGQNLTAYPMSGDISHGTGALGIAAGGAVGLRRYTGIAPEADLVLIHEEDPVVGLATAESLGVHVSFYEWNSPADLQDGAGPFETALTDAAARGMVQVTAAGNLANADHVMELTGLQGSTERVELTTDGMGVHTYRAFWLNIYWDGPLAAATIALEGSSSGRLDVNGPFAQGVLDGIEVNAWAEETAAGNARVLVVAGDGTSALPETVLGLEIAPNQPITRLRGMLFDDASGWGKGVSWLSDQSDTGTALMPSTADTVIAVAAYGGRHDLDMFGWGGVDERRSYSGMGPRIDGAAQVDISAPDDPYSPAGGGDPSVFYSAFGGTSGALPHVAGAAAVVLSSGVPYNHAAVEELLTTTARRDTFTGNAFSESYGHGKVDVARAIFGQSDSFPPKPTLQVTGPETPVAGRAFALTAEVQQPGGDAGDILVGWDVGYDGIEEVPPAAARDLRHVADTPGPLRVLVRAKNVVTGRVTRRLYRTDVAEDCAIAGCATGCCLEDGLCGACAPPDAGAPADSGQASIDAGASIDRRPRDRDRGGGCGCTASEGRGAPWFGLLLLPLLALGHGSARRRLQ